MKKYAVSFMRYLVFYLLGFLIFFITDYFTRAFYELLGEWFPSIFPTYGPIHNEEEYNMLRGILTAVTAAITLYLATYFATVFDNERFEHVISRTDGFYTLREGLQIYIGRYLFPDVTSGAVIPILVSLLTLIKAPEQAPTWVLGIIDKIDVLLSVQNAFTEPLGYVTGICTLVLLSVLFRMPSAYFAVKRFRAVWLSDAEEAAV